MEYLKFFHQLYDDKEERIRKAGRHNLLFQIPLIIFIFSSSLFFPIIGLLFYIVWKHDRPKAAKWPELATIIGFTVNLILSFYINIFVNWGLIFG